MKGQVYSNWKNTSLFLAHWILRRLFLAYYAPKSLQDSMILDGSDSIGSLGNRQNLPIYLHTIDNPTKQLFDSAKEAINKVQRNT